MDSEIFEITNDTNLSYTSSILESQEDDESRIVTDPTNLFVTRFNCVKSWYMKCSWNCKSRFLNKLLQKLSDESYLSIIVESLNYRIDKLKIYSNSLPNTNYIYDKKLKDHNRSLEKNFLEETIASDLAWFEYLKVPQQIDIIIELLKLGGEALVDQFYVHAVKLQGQRTRSQSGIEKDEKYVKVEAPSLVNAMISNDAKNPLAIELEKKTKIWNDFITKYTNQVFGITDKDKSSNSKRKNSAGSDKSSHSKKSSKSPPKGKSKAKKDDINVVDQVQQLPVWIVKKIFNYLDQKTLKKIKDVNKYWAYVVDDLANEKSCRKYMDKTIRKMENIIRSREMGIGYKFTPKPECKATRQQRRMQQLAERGAVHPKLQNANDYKNGNTTLLEKAVREGASKYVLPTYGFESFPRNNPISETLFETNKCTLSEIGKQPYRAKPVSESTRTSLSNKSSTSSEKSFETGRRSIKSVYYDDE